MADDRRKPRPHFSADERPLGPSLRSLRPRVTLIGMSAEAVSALPRHVVAPNARVRRLPQGLLARRHIVGRDRPDLIVSPLLGRGIDVVALVGQLARAGFAGRYLAVTSELPDVDLVRAEVHGHAPELNLDIMTLNGPPALHLV